MGLGHTEEHRRAVMGRVTASVGRARRTFGRLLIGSAGALAGYYLDPQSGRGRRRRARRAVEGYLAVRSAERTGTQVEPVASGRPPTAASRRAA